MPLQSAGILVSGPLLCAVEERLLELKLSVVDVGDPARPAVVGAVDVFSGSAIAKRDDTVFVSKIDLSG